MILREANMNPIPNHKKIFRCIDMALVKFKVALQEVFLFQVPTTQQNPDIMLLPNMIPFFHPLPTTQTHP
jgi:hypothetical protein